MNEGNLFIQQQKHQQSRKLFSSSRDSELELLDTTETSSPEIRSRSQSESSTHREALLFFEQHRLFQNSPELDFGREESYGGDCELRSISSASRTSSPAIVGGAHFHQEHHQSTEKDRPNYQQRQQKSGNCNLLCHQQQVHQRHKNAALRQQSDSNLLESAGSSLAAGSFLTGTANIGSDNQTNSFNDPHSSGTSSGDRGGRARSQSQGQCGSVRRRQESCSSVIIVSTDNKNGRESGGDTKQKASKWLEEIQFKAQYQHYRTNNYASVVSSASSLDKSDGGTGSSGTTAVGTCVIGPGNQQKNTAGPGTSGIHSTNKNASEAERPSSSKPGGLDSTKSSNNSRHRHHSHQFTKSCNQQQEQEQEDEAGEELQYLRSEERKDCEEECINSENLNRQNSITTKQCWNFPRVKLRKLFTAKSLDDILGGGRGRSAGGSSRSGLLQGRKKSLQVAGLSSSSAHEEFSQDEVSGERSSSSPDFIIRSTTTTHTKKAQLLRDNKLSLFQQNDDGVQLLIVKPAHDGSKSPGAHSSKSAIVISTTAPSKQRKGPVFIKANRQKSRSFSALTSAILSRVPGHHSSGGNSPCNSTTSSANAGSSSGLSIFFKRSHQENKNTPPVVPPKKSGHIVPCAKSENCLNRFVASATCAKFADYFSTENSKVHKSTTSATPVEPFISQQQSSSSEYYAPGSSSAASSSPAFTVVTAQPRKWTAIKNKWDQKLQASGDRQKEIGASLASVSNNAQIFRKTHHHHQPRQRSNSLSPLDNPEDGKSIESLLEITSPSPTLQEVRFLDTPEIRYASPIAVRSSRGDYHNVDYDDDDEEDNNEDESVTLIEGATSIINSSIVGERYSRTPSRASSACSSYTVSSLCSECKDSDNIEDEENDTVGEMTRHQGNTGATAVGGKKRSRDHHHHHHRHDKHSSSKEKPKLVVANVTYLQRPMSPGLVLRESSPSSSTVSGTIDSFGMPGGSGNLSGAGRGAEAGGNLYSPSVIRNNNVFTNNNNQPSSQSKSQQAKLEFLKSFSASQSYDQQNVIGSDCSRKRDPLCANNSSIVNANERQASCGAVGFISPSSSSGASDIRSSGSVGVGIIGTNNAVVGGGRSNIRPAHQPFLLGDLQDPFLTNRQRDHFTDARLTEASGGVMIGYDACDGANNSNRSRGAPSGGGVDEQQRGSQPPRLQRGAEHCSNLDQGRSFVIDSHSERRHHSHQGAGQGDSGAVCGTRSTDTGGGRDTGNPPGETGEGRVSTATLNQGAPQTLAQQSSINNNLFVDVDFEDTEDTMGDLQSPQYVKRTAHMFDSRFSTEADANGHDRRNPSYLNVSRSVSGYSCLTYNNGSVTSETVTKSVLGNGASLLTSGARVTPAATRLKSDFSIHPPYSRNKVPNTDDDSSDHSSNQSATSPPPSLPPINTTSAHGRYSDSPFFQNGTNRGDDLIDDTPYIPSHGKSFIMQRIERLYGTDAVSNKSVVSRKSSNVTTISITRESPTRGNERIIPIKVESRDDHQNNLYNSGRSPNKNESSRQEQQALEEDGKISSDINTTAVIIPIIRGSDSSRSSRVSTEDTDEEEDSRNATKRRSPTKSMGHLNGNANRYRNDEDRATNGNESAGAINGSSITLVKNVHANGNEDCTPTPLKTALSRESSTGSDDTNDFSENSLELGSISSDVESRKSVINRQDSKEDSLYSSRGASSPSKPKPKPKPKDMALLRTLSRSPALKTGTENLDKTAISYSIVQPEAAGAVSVSKLDDNIKISEDQTDADNFSALSDIKNTISAAVTKSVPQGKVTPPPPAADKSSYQTTPTGCAVDKENTVLRVTENEKVHKTANSAASPTASFSVKDGNYFLNEMKKVTEEILKLSGEAAKELDTIDESEDRAGSIHAAVGKGNLLVKKKFKQFEELCHANLRGKTGDEPETTDEDLAGFWDMVMIQVEQVYALFVDLKKKQAPESEPVTPVKTASPKRVPVSTSKSSTRPTAGATPKVNSAAAKARDEARRKLLAEKRKAMKNQLQDAQEPMAAPEPEAEIQIFAPETPHTG